MAKRKFVVGSRPAASQGVGVFGLLGVILSRRSVMVLEVKSVLIVARVSNGVPSVGLAKRNLLR